MSCIKVPKYLDLECFLVLKKITKKEDLLKKALNKEKISKGTTDPGVDCFDQQFWVGLIW